MARGVCVCMSDGTTIILKFIQQIREPEGEMKRCSICSKY